MCMYASINYGLGRKTSKTGAKRNIQQKPAESGSFVCAVPLLTGKGWFTTVISDRT